MIEMMNRLYFGEKMDLRVGSYPGVASDYL